MTEDRVKKLKCDAFIAQAPPGVRDQYIKSLHPLLIVVKSSHVDHTLILSGSCGSLTQNVLNLRLLCTWFLSES